MGVDKHLKKKKIKKKLKNTCVYDFGATEILSPLLYEPDI